MKIRKPTAPGIVLFLLCLMYFLTYIDRVNVSTAAGSIKKEFGFSNTQLGLIFSGFAYPYALFQVIGGWVGDRLGPRKTLLICGAIWAVATALTGLATGLLSLMFFRIALGFGEGATFPTATRAMQSWTPAGKRGFAQGVTHSFARLGNAVTPPIVAALMIWLSWRGAFVCWAWRASSGSSSGGCTTATIPASTRPSHPRTSRAFLHRPRPRARPGTSRGGGSSCAFCR